MHIDVPCFDSVRVLTVGDVMLDRYWQGDATRISPEAPVPVVHVKQMEERAGGAGNVALNLSALGCQATLLGVVGDDVAGKTLQGLLEKDHINCQFQYLADFPTISKMRVIGRHQQLLRLDFEEAFHADGEPDLLGLFKTHLAKTDVVILSDYGKGTLKAVQQFIQHARAAGVPVLVDPKSRDFSLYRDATLVTPNLKEFEAVVGPCHSEADIVTKGHLLMQAHNLQALLVTRSEQGMTLLQRDQPPLHLSTHAREVYDVTGAGDTVIALLAAVLAAKQPLATAAVLANLAAGVVVTKLGAATVSPAELRRALQRHYASDSGILTEAELLMAVADARAHHETIVMTNGCFDILHAGHVRYLEEAKGLGKRLIVAVNDDASVTKLKGPGRPINSLQQRMAMLTALRVVDWVVPFSEETPARLIAEILPDVLVKGDDYQPADIAGSDTVIANGGVVTTLPLLAGHSTTNIINKIKAVEKE